jgi:hypothetical protein
MRRVSWYEPIRDWQDAINPFTPCTYDSEHGQLTNTGRPYWGSGGYPTLTRSDRARCLGRSYVLDNSPVYFLYYYYLLNFAIPRRTIVRPAIGCRPA